MKVELSMSHLIGQKERERERERRVIPVHLKPLASVLGSFHCKLWRAAWKMKAKKTQEMMQPFLPLFPMMSAVASDDDDDDDS